MKKILLLLLVAVLAMGVVSAVSTCVDSDASEVDPYLVYGDVTVTYDNGSTSYGEDFCGSYYNIFEYECYLASDGDYYPMETYLNCQTEYGAGSQCLDGACFENTCTDTDSGNDPEVYGTLSMANGTSLEDECHGNEVYQHYCNFTTGAVEERYNCEDDGMYCDAGECVEYDTCTDTDDGEDSLVYGEVTDTEYELWDGSVITNTSSDFCDSETYQVEYYCDAGAIQQGYVNCESEFGSGYYCVDGECIPEASHTEFTFEFDSSVDLSDYDSTLSSVPAIYLYTENNEIVLESEHGSGYLIGSYLTVEAEEVWFYTPEGMDVYVNGTSTPQRGKWVAIFYRDLSDNQVKLYGHVDAAGSNLTLVTLQPGETEYRVATRKAPRFMARMMMIMEIGRDTDLSWSYGSANGEYASLGRTVSLEEPNEVRFGTLGIGARTSDVTSRDGLVVQEPATYGASDMVSLNVPRTYSTLSRAASQDEGVSLGTKLKGVWQYFFF